MVLREASSPIANSSCRRSAELRIRRQKAGGNARGSVSVSTRGSAPRRRRAPTPGELLPLLHCTSVTVLGQVAVRCAGHRRCPNSSTVTDSASAAAALHKEVSRTRCEVPAGLRRPPSAGAGLAGEDRPVRPAYLGGFQVAGDPDHASSRKRFRLSRPTGRRRPPARVNEALWTIGVARSAGVGRGRWSGARLSRPSGAARGAAQRHARQLESVLREHLCALTERSEVLAGSSSRRSSTSTRCRARSTGTPSRAPPTGTPMAGGRGGRRPNWC